MYHIRYKISGLNLLKFKTKKRLNLPLFSIIIWLLTLVAMIWTEYSSHSLNEYFAIIPGRIIEQIHKSSFQTLRLASSLFLHGNWQHWLGNMVLFLIIAIPLEKRIGSFWFLLLYFVSGFAGNLYCIYNLQNSESYLLGASGAVSGILGAWIVLFPQLKIRIIIPVGLYLQKAQIPVLLLSAIWLGIQVVLQLVSSDDYTIVWMSHIVGFITGFCLAWLYRIVN